MVAVALPEAGLIVAEHVEAENPLDGLPEVEVRNHQTQWIAVLQIERLTFGEFTPNTGAGNFDESDPVNPGSQYDRGVVKPRRASETAPTVTTPCHLQH